VSKPNYQEVEYFNDARGLAVHRGDEVAYAVSQSHTAVLKLGVVKNVHKYEWGTRSGGTRTHWLITVRRQGGQQDSRLEHPNRIVVLRTAQEIEQATYPSRLVFPTSDREERDCE
jgi:hypothetical protein